MLEQAALAFPISGFEGLFDEFDAQFHQLGSIFQGLVGRPGRVGIDAEKRVGVFAEFAKEAEVVVRAQLDFIHRPGFFLDPLDHFLHGADADGVVGQGVMVGGQAPELVKGLSLQPGEQVVRGNIQGALLKGVVL